MDKITIEKLLDFSKIKIDKVLEDKIKNQISDFEMEKIDIDYDLCDSKNINYMDFDALREDEFDDFLEDSSKRRETLIKENPVINRVM